MRRTTARTSSSAIADPTRRSELLRNWQELRRWAARRGARGVLADVAGEFRRNNLLTYASAISFQLVFALVPALLAALAILGFLDLASFWEQEIAPTLREQLSPAGFEVLSDTVQTVLGSQRGYWLTLGLAFALWQVSGAARAAMRALNDVYDAEEQRSLLRRLLVSFAIAVVAALGVAGAVVSFEVVPVVADGIAARVAGIVVAFAFLVGVLAAILRLAPAVPQPPPWLGFVTTVVAGGWLLASALFAAWTARIVSYSSIYGGFAVAILLLSYVYLLAVVFLAGAQVDALVRKHTRG